ncbi:MAG: hypothetical protein IJH77_06420 [Mogibacterium sp.]|nr:hypothetical protein [Mogibacterium sp.]
MSIPYLYNTEVWTKMQAEAEHRMQLNSGEVFFRSYAEDHVFYDEEGRAEAVINTIAYVGEGKADRPVLFFWNGGPGSATSMLQLECFGPYQMPHDAEGRQVNTLEEDPACLLDLCDLVFVDPVGVGFSRLLRKEAESRYYSLMGDARSNAFAVLDWIRTHRRWNSPVYLVGESYGTIRVSRILEEFGRNPMEGNRMMLGLPVAGVVLIGVALSISPSGRITDPAVDLLTASLPSMAAVHWYHNLRGTAADGGDPISEESFIDEAWQFAAQEIQPARFLGDDCPEETIYAAAEKLAHYTGMDRDYFVRSRLCLNSIDDFMLQVTAKKGTRVDIYDARTEISLKEQYNLVGNSNVPLQIMNGSLAEKLGIGTDRQYYTGNINVNDHWSYEGLEHPTNMDCLRSAMARMPEMKVLVASGRYDLCTLLGNTRYIFAHAGLRKDGLILREYSGGHGVYSSAEGKAEFLADIRAMMEG